jgi:hypothetical protein
MPPKTGVSDDSVVNLLIISLLKDGVDPKVLAEATGIPEGTIRRKFPMSLVKPRAPLENKKPKYEKGRSSTTDQTRRKARPKNMTGIRQG